MLQKIGETYEGVCGVKEILTWTCVTKKDKVFFFYLLVSSAKKTYHYLKFFHIHWYDMV